MAQAYVEDDSFERDTDYIPDRITRDGRDGWPVEPGRYRLVAAKACPWATRAIIVRQLLGLEEVISLGTPGPVHDERSWTFDLDPGGRDPVLGYERLQEGYFRRFPDYPRGITVPAIVEVASGKVVTNDFPQITHDLSFEWREHQRPDALRIPRGVKGFFVHENQAERAAQPRQHLERRLLGVQTVEGGHKGGDKRGVAGRIGHRSREQRAGMLIAFLQPALQL